MTREMYARVTVQAQAKEIILGVQLREDDDYRVIRRKARQMVETAVTYIDPLDDELEIVKLLEFRLADWFPLRAYFIEIADGDDFVQVFDPRGFLKARCDCPCREGDGAG